MLNQLLGLAQQNPKATVAGAIVLGVLIKYRDRLGVTAVLRTHARTIGILVGGYVVGAAVGYAGGSSMLLDLVLEWLPLWSIGGL